MKNRNYVNILCCLLLSFGMLNGQGWERIYIDAPSDPNDYLGAYSPVVFEDENGYVFGVNANGTQQLWYADFNGYVINSIDVPAAIGSLQRTSDGYVYAGGGQNISCYKYDENGVQMWSQTYDNGTENDAVSDFNMNGDGDFFIVGAQIIGGNLTAYTKKVDGDGNELWHSSLPAPNNVYQFHVAPLADGGCITAGGPSFFNGPDVAPTLVVRYSNTGELLWEINLNDPMQVKGIDVSGDGGVVLGGTTTDYQQKILKLDSDGNEIWVSSLPLGTGIIGDVKHVSDGGFVVLNTEHSDDVNWDIVLTKFDSNGGVDWYETYGGAYGDYGYFVRETTGGYVIAASANQQGENSSLYWIRTDEEGNAAPYLIEGNVMYDLDGDCTIEAGDLPLENWIVEATGVTATFYAAADENGYYSMEVNEGDYVVSVTIDNPYWEYCVNEENVSVDAVADTVEVDFPIKATLQCPFMQVNIQNAAVRLCETSTFYIAYENIGTQLAEGAYIELDLHDSLSLVSAELPYTDAGNNEYVFDLGDVNFLTGGAFAVEVQAGCSEELVGQTLCTEAYIYPDSTCLDANPEWSGASVEITAVCTGEEVVFTIENVGEQDMLQALNYIVIQDDVIMLEEPYGPLMAGESIEVSEPANGAFYRVESPQVPNHPGASMPSAFVEACGEGETYSLGFVNQYTLNDADAFIDLACMEVVAAYDPNEKVAYPSGYQEEHYILNGTELEYVLHFQNTGNSFARDVVLVDRLSAHLDPATIVPTVSSHDYDFELLADGIVRFTFEDIMLPDSTENEPASHGYVTFKIAPKDDLPLGTEINNYVDIFFDYNPSIRTNTTWHTIGENYLTVEVEEPLEEKVVIKAYPNPFSTHTTIELKEESREAQIVMFDMSGRKVLEQIFTGGLCELEARHFAKGTYFFVIEADGEHLGRGKLVVQ